MTNKRAIVIEAEKVALEQFTHDQRAALRPHYVTSQIQNRGGWILHSWVLPIDTLNIVRSQIPNAMKRNNIDTPCRFPGFQYVTDDMKNFILALSLYILLNLHPVLGADFPYDVNADATAELSGALAMGRQTNKKVLAVFGANWCAECRTLDKEIYDNKGPLGDEKYIIVKVDVGNFDKNIDLAAMYGNPIKKGIPAALVITPENKTVYKGPLAHLIHPQRRFMKLAFYIAAAIAALVAAGWLGSLALRAVRRHAD